MEAALREALILAARAMDDDLGHFATLEHAGSDMALAKITELQKLLDD